MHEVLTFLSAKEVALVMTFLQILEKSRALLAPLASRKGYLLWCHLFSFIFYSNETHYLMSSIFSLILLPYSSMVLVLDLVERFLLKLFSIRSYLATPNHFTGTSTYTKLSTNIQTFKTSLCCGGECFTLAMLGCVFTSLCQSVIFCQNDKAGKKCFHLGR